MSYEAQLESASALQKDAFVFDYVPCGEPILMTARHRRVMEAGLAAKHSVGRILRDMTRDRLDELEASPETSRLVGSTWEASGVDAVQVTLGGRALAPQSWEECIDDVGYWLHRARIGNMRVCASTKELREARADGEIGLLFVLQDSGVLGADLDRLDLLFRMGVRVAQLTYNTRNLIGDGCEERDQSGLSKFGVAAVRRMNELGIVVDVSHCSHATTMDAIAVSEGPVAVTHSCCSAVAAHPRAKSDDVLKALRDVNGFFGVVTVPNFLAPGEDATLATMLRHIEHAVSILGTERVGIATDWGGWTPDLPAELIEAATENFRKLGFKADTSPKFGVGLPEFDAWEKWPNLTAGLLAAGYSENETRQLIGGSRLAFQERVEARSSVT
ncbi:dipeptidase [Amorphus sp. 3PC139-8]|uniref:dipeptidase n=1 Tax=Amorphus sp. 3PC139-8 TaxID=2735676 RepID=UPI00345DE9AA